MNRDVSFPWIAPKGLHSRRRGTPSGQAPRMAAAAVRIPQPKALQLPLSFVGGPQIFIHEGARQALERRLEAAHGGVVQLAVTDNRRRMVTRTRDRGRLRVRLH
ncbi:MAG TPA: hypothetical protein PKD61_21370, partial [Polyangiaceae bacterium]|nr:hypothetical protein [Polyangiaceae bacterium]